MGAPLSDNLHLRNNMPVELLKSFGQSPQFRMRAVAGLLDRGSRLVAQVAAVMFHADPQLCALGYGSPR
jgi:hypothetical protein